MILFAALLAGLIGAFALQDFLPPIGFMHGARLLLHPLILLYAGVALPYPAALGLAFLGGAMWDMRIVQVVGGQVEISPGTSIIVYGVICSLMHGLRPLFLRGRWEVYCLAVLPLLPMASAAEFFLLSFRRGGFVYDPELPWRLLAPALAALVLSPLVHLLYHRLLPGPEIPGAAQPATY